MGKLRKGMAVMTAAVMIAGIPGAGGDMEVAHAADMSSSLLADFTFDDIAEGADTFTGGRATAAGGYTLIDHDGGKALHLDGTAAQVLTLTDAEGGSLLTGAQELTVSYDIKNDRAGTNWAFYAAPDDNDQDPGKEHYIGLLHKDGNLTVERYNNTNGRPGNPVAAVGSEWAHVDVVFGQTDTTIYVDGSENARVESSYALPDILGDNSILQIGKANWGGGEYFQGALDNLKIYSKALTVEELDAVFPAAGYVDNALAQFAESIADVVIEGGAAVLPDYDGTVTWKSSDDRIVIGEDGKTATAQQPAHGEAAVETTLTAVVAKYGRTTEVEVPAVIKAEIVDSDAYGYLMVHFVEDSEGYAEKIYLDISRGDNPEQWDPLNGREPILASNLGKTGVRDPFLTYNPETKTYYILATDLRVFGGDNAGWGAWQNNYSTKMNVWESKDLITWSELRQFDVALDTEGVKQANLGMMWAPEATWVPDYYGEGKGAFVVYWSSQGYLDEAQTQRDGGSDIMYGVTTDFTQETYAYGGKMLEGGTNGWIDTNIIRDGDKTYHVTKSQKPGEEIIMEVTDSREWWKLDATTWTRVQTAIGAGRYGAVEGPATFKDHSTSNRWYLFVDDLPAPGYQPMVSTDLAKGWDYLDSRQYFLTSHTKHGGIISLTKAQYDAIRRADAVSAVKEDLGNVTVTEGDDAETLTSQLPETAEVNLAYGYGTSQLPVVWNTEDVKMDTAGSYTIQGVVQSIGANNNQWVGKDNSESYLAEDKELYSSTAIAVTMTVEVKEAEQSGGNQGGDEGQGGGSQGGDEGQGGGSQGGDEGQGSGSQGGGNQSGSNAQSGSSASNGQTNSAGTVKTGDSVNVVLPVMGTVGAMMCAAYVLFRKRRNA